MQSKPKVVITGIGIVSPLGNDTQTTWQSLLAKKSGIDTIRKYDASRFPTCIGAEVKNFNIAERIRNKKILHRANEFVQYALAASDEAMQDAGIRPTKQTNARWGITAGCGLICADYDFLTQIQSQFAPQGEIDTDAVGQYGLNSIPPSQFARMQCNSGVALMAQQFDIQGYSVGVHTACASGGQALGLGLQAIRRGDCDYVLAGGFDSMLNPIGVAAFCLLGALSTNNDPPQTASRPFDLTRNGFVLGEGAAFLILEKYESAKKRHAKIYAELAGEGNSLSCYRITDSPPDGDGAKQAIEQALRDANLTPQDIQYINAHGTSTKMNDLSETNAIKAVLQDHAKKVAVSSTKSQVGHLISAAGAIEIAFAALSIQQQKIPMTMNLHNPDPDCDLDYVSDAPRDLSINAALSNSFGFGGSNSVIALKRVE